MGSHANSLHVKHNDADEVIAAIETAMCEAGYQLTADEPDDEATWDAPSPSRSLCVSDSHNGWVGVLDSSMNYASLACELSRTLETYTIWFMVNDSDSWHYQLYHRGSRVHEFDSSRGIAGKNQSGQTVAGIAQLVSGGGLADMQQELGQHVREKMQQLEDEVPAEIRDIHERMQEGSATEVEMKRYREWGQTQAQRFNRQMHEMLLQKMPWRGGDEAPADISSIHERMQEGADTEDEIKRYREWGQTQTQQFNRQMHEMISQKIPSLGKQSVPEAQLAVHVPKLRPILAPDARDHRVVEVLGRQSLFAEETLGEFLRLIGIQPCFAQLSFAYLDDFSEADLLEADIKTVAQLRFTTHAPTG